jgi:hypothetical protein
MVYSTRVEVDEPWDVATAASGNVSIGDPSNDPMAVCSPTDPLQWLDRRVFP